MTDNPPISAERVKELQIEAIGDLFLEVDHDELLALCDLSLEALASRAGGETPPKETGNG